MASNTKDGVRPSEPRPTMEEASPVDEVRYVREGLSSRFDQDIDRLADHAAAVAAVWRGKLNLRPAARSAGGEATA